MPVNTTSGNARRSHRAVIDCPANAIPRPTSPPNLPSGGLWTRSEQPSSPAAKPSAVFPIARHENVVEAFPVHQAIAFVIAGKALDLATPTLRDTDVQIVRHSDVESARAAGNDVPNTSCGPSRFNLLPSKL
jgi:hypothetical protein